MMGIESTAATPTQTSSSSSSATSSPVSSTASSASTVPEGKQEKAPKTKVVDLSYKNLTMDNARSAKPVVSKEILAKAIRRLMLDLQESQKNPLDTVVARPLESDFFECKQL